MPIQFQKYFSAAAVIVLLLITGCSSSGNSTSAYGGAAVASAVAKNDKAVNALKAAKSEVRSLQKKIKLSNRNLKRAERRLKRKRISSKRKRNLAAKIARADKAIEKNTKLLSKAERNLKRVERRAKQAQLAAVRAQKRDKARKLADARREEARIKREATQKLATARRDKERKAAEIRRAETREKLAEVRAERLKERKKLAALIAKRRANGAIISVFGYSGDPALKNVKDYRARVDEGFELPAIPIKKMDPRFLRQQVYYKTKERPGTLVVDTSKRFVYLVQRGGRAMRYGIGVGRAGFAWEGEAKMAWKKKWPTWTPPQEMIARQPKLARYGGENGMEPGLKNPLGARALYIFQNGQDTLYRLHGTPKWASIGTAASSGCIRLINQDIIDLYSRVPNGAKIVVKQG